MEKILGNKKNVIIFIITCACLIGSFWIYNKCVNNYSSKIAIQIDDIDKLSKNRFAPENHSKKYNQWLVLSKNANNKSQIFKMIKQSKEYEKNFAKDNYQAKKNEKRIKSEIDSEWTLITVGAMAKGSQSEDYANKISKVWHDAIFEDYVTVNGIKYTDFNTAIIALQSQYSNEFDELNSYFKNNTALTNNVADMIIKYYPEKSDRATALQRFSNNISIFNDEAINPSGSYSTRVSDLKKLESEVLSSYSELGSSF